MGKKYNFDYLIIGSGPAGGTAARLLAANKKLRIGLVEAQDFGGSNLCARDIPHLVSQSFAHDFYNLSIAPEMSNQTLHFNFPSIASHQIAITTLLGAGDTTRYKSLGITCISGYAHFLDSHTIAIGDNQYTAENFILASGAKTSTGDIIGLDSVRCLTPDEVPRLRRQPKFVFIIGGGPTGCEIAEYFAKLGTKAIIMEQASSLLPKEDPEAGNALRDYFTNELGVMVVTDSKVVALEKDGTAKRVIFKSGSEDKVVRVDCVVLATGSTPCTDYGLENAGVRLNKNGGIMANKFFQTTTKNIYAIGDCLGGNHSSTERAEYEASILADNILHRSKGFADYKGFIRFINTCPSVACVGSTEARLKRHRAKYKTSIVYLRNLPAAIVDGLDYGFVKIIASPRTGHILGATIVAPHAELMATELSLAIRHRSTILELASTPYMTNSYSYAIKLATRQLIK